MLRCLTPLCRANRRRPPGSASRMPETLRHDLRLTFRNETGYTVVQFEPDGRT